MQNTYRHQSLANKSVPSKRTLTIDSFKGLDYASAEMNMSSDTSPDMQNLMYDQSLGRIVTRDGWKTFADLSSLGTTKINGVWRFNVSENLPVMVYHIGTNLYWSKEYETNSIPFNGLTLITSGLPNVKSCGFIGNYDSDLPGRLYILTGTGYYVVKGVPNGYAVTMSCNRVLNDTETYIPTTTIGIPYGTDDDDISTATPLDDINILTDFVKNGLVSKFYGEGDEWNCVWDLDYSIGCRSLDDTQRIRVEVELMTDSLMISSVNYCACKTWTFTDTPSNDLSFNLGNANYILVPANFVGGVAKTTSEITRNSDGSLNYNGSSTRVAGILKSQSIRLFDCKNPVLGSTNVYITYPRSHDRTTYCMIDYCTFGTIFNNRLFVSGNKYKKNRDWHSSDPDKSLTYFSDLDYCDYGTNLTAVVGYDTFGDGDLIVVKETSTTEPTFYRRSYEMINATDYAGNNVSSSAGTTLYEEGFPMYPINSFGGLGGVSTNSVINFYGDTLILTRDGLKLLASRQNVYDKSKFLADVSTKINPVLCKDDLSKAVMFVFNDRLFLRTDKHTFIAEYSLQDSNGQYSWFKWTNFDVRFAYDDGKTLYFQMDDGELCTFNDKCRDVKTKFLPSGAITFDSSRKTFVFNESYTSWVKDENAMFLLDMPIYVLLAYVNFTNGQFDAGAFEAALYDGMKLYLSDSTEVTVKRMNFNEYTSKFAIYGSDGRQITNVSGYNSLFEKVDSISAKDIYDVQEAYHDFKVRKHVYVSVTRQDVEPWEDSVQLVTMPLQIMGSLDGTQVSLVGRIQIVKNVDDYYTTAPMSMGTVAYMKNIFGWVLVNDTSSPSYMRLGYYVSRKQGTFDEITDQHHSASTELKITDFSFDRLQTTTDMLPKVYTRYKTLPRVNFIRFMFMNGSGNRMVLGQLTLIYTITTLTKGVR